MPKILHCADLHVGASYNIIPKYLDRHAMMLKGIYGVAVRNKCDLTVISGDLFQKHTKPAKIILKEQNALLTALLNYDQKFPTIIIPGNHDQIDNDGQTMIDHLGLLEAKRKFKQTYIVTTVPRRIQIGNIMVLAFPPDIDPRPYMENKKWYDPKEYDYTVMVLHESYEGYETDSGWKADPDKVRKWRTYKGVTYYALGDIHMPQHINKCSHAWYCGSPIQHNFGDGKRRGVMVVDLDNPTAPKLVKLKNIPNLVTMRAKNLKKENIPDDVIIRLEGSIEDLQALGELPSNVVKTKNLVDDSVEVADIEATNDDLLVRGLPGWLAEKGHGQQFIDNAVATVKRLWGRRED